MKLFKTKVEKRLDVIINSLEMNMSNNYKDNAQDDLKEFEKTLSMIKEEGSLKEKAIRYYDGILADYKEKMMGYSHKDQKPYWT